MRRKRGVKHAPLTRLHLFYLSTREVYAVSLLIALMAAALMVIIAVIQIFSGDMALEDIGGVLLGALAIAGIMLIIAYGLTARRTAPPYRRLRKMGVNFPECLSGKQLTCTDGDYYIYADEQWFVAAFTQNTSAIYANIVDFNISVNQTVVTGARGYIMCVYQFACKDGGAQYMKLLRTIKPFKQWVKAHGGEIAK